MFTSLTAFPLLSFALAIFAVVTLLSGGDTWVATQAFSVMMPVGRYLVVSQGDVMVLVSLLMLFVEIVKAVSTGALTLINHGLSVLVLVVCIILFITQASFANTTFLMLTVMGLFDVVAGIVITTVSARRDFGGSSLNH
jgi:hypothetical protein